MMFELIRVGMMGMLLLVPCAAAGAFPFRAEESTAAVSLEFQETVIAGGPDDFMEVKHLVLHGSNFEIGKKLGQIGWAQLRTGPVSYPNRRRTRAQLSYFRKYYPGHVERMRGVAAAFNTSLENHAMNFSALFYGFSLPGCSAVFYPPGTTVGGQGVLSRNFDFSTGTLQGKILKPEERPVCECPYLIEMHPDEGYASLALCCFDLLGGVVDGINSEGLCIALLADGELADKHGVDPFTGFQPGFSELQILRYVLDTCADVEQAKNAFLEAKLYYNFAPNHYIIADRSGDSFIWENTAFMHYGHIIEGKGEPQITTNFSLHLHPDLEKLPEEFDRFNKMRKRFSERNGKYDLDFIKETSSGVAFCGGSYTEGYAPPRTIWHTLYFPAERRLEIDFYLGDEKDEESPAGRRIRRSGYMSFSIED
jgi:hypothetical protein